MARAMTCLRSQEAHLPPRRRIRAQRLILLRLRQQSERGSVSLLVTVPPISLLIPSALIPRSGVCFRIDHGTSMLVC